MPQGLILKIGADVKEATTALKEVVVEAKVAGKEVERSFSQSTLPLTTGIKATSQSVKALTPQISALGDTIETLRAKALAKQQFLLVEKDITKVAILNKEISVLIAEITRLGNVGKAGFNSLGVAIKAPVSQLAKLQGQLKNFKAGLLTAQSPESFARLNRAIEVTQTRITTLGRAGKVGFDQLGNAIPPVVSGLSNVAGGASKAFSILRQAAFILPGIGIAGLIGGLSNLVVGLFETTEGLNSVERASISLNDELASMGRSLKSLGDDLQFLRDVAKLRNELAGVEGGVLELLDLKKQEENDRALIAEIDGSIKILRDKQKQFLAAIDNLRQAGRIDISFDSEGLIPEAFFKDENKKTQSFLSDFNSTTKELNKLNEELIKVSRNSSKTLLEIGVQENKNLEEANKKAEELRKKRLRAIQDEYDFQSGLLDLQLSLLQRIRKEFNAAFKISKDQEARFKVSADINIDTLATNFPQEVDRISSNVKKLVEDLTSRNPILLLAHANLRVGIDFQNDLDKTLDAINKTIQQTAVNAFSGLGESLGAALVGGDLKDGFRAFANIIAEGFSAIGKQMIAAAPIIAALKAAIKSLNPAILLPAGLALVAIGAALRGSIGKGITGFAGGGLVSGPTMGMIGEGSGTSRSNPEVIAPLDKLKSMLADLNVGNQRVQVAVTGRLRGRDMALQNARTSRTNRRLGA